MLHDIVVEFKHRVDVVIVEGLFAFFNEALNEQYDKRLFVKVSKRTFFIRKAMDTRWGYEPTWFIEHIWKSFLANGQPPPNKSDFFTTSGEDEFNMPPIFRYLHHSNRLTV